MFCWALRACKEGTTCGACAMMYNFQIDLAAGLSSWDFEEKFQEQQRCIWGPLGSLIGVNYIVARFTTGSDLQELAQSKTCDAQRDTR